LILLGLLLPVASVLAQTTATITGQVQDQTGGMLPGVTVTITHVDTGVARTTVTDAEGRYAAPGLRVGDYEIAAALEGFQAGLRRGVSLTSGRSAVVDFTLQMATLAGEEVVVTAEAALVNTTSATVSTLVEQQQIADLPLNGRDLMGAVMLQPGIIRAPLSSNVSQGFGQHITAGGARFSQNVYLQDGIPAADVSGNTGGAHGLYSGAESVEEFQVVMNNYNAEYRSAAGAIISAVTKSGTNDFHGSAYEYHRNHRLDAIGYFDDDDNEPDFSRNQFGGSLGGPIVRQRTFFFANYEGFRERLEQTRTRVVPSLSARQGIVGGTRVDIAPDVLPYLALYPLPNGQDHGDGRADFIGILNNPTDSTFVTGKIDQQLGSASFSATYSYDDSKKDLADSFNEFRNINSMRKQTVATHWQKAGTTTLHDVRAGFARTTPKAERLHTTPMPELAYVPGMATLGGLSITGLSSLGVQDPLDMDIQNIIQAMYTATMIRGRHSLKAGADVQRFSYKNQAFGRAAGQFGFDAIERFLQGRADDLEMVAPAPAGQPTELLQEFNGRQTMYAFYVQDDYRPTSNLTLNLGLRYEFTDTLKEKDGKSSTLRDIWQDADTTIGPFFKNPTLKNFSPRLGVAWDPTGRGRSSLRGGFGIFYDPPMWFNVKSNLAEMRPFSNNGELSSSNNFDIDFPDAFETQGHLLSQSPRIRGTQYDTDSTTMYRGSLTFQQQLGSRTVVTAGYTGSRGTHLWRQTDANIGTWIVLPDGRSFFPANNRRINPNFQTVRYQVADGNSFYHALELDFRMRMVAGLRSQVAYTFSKSIDEASDRSGSGFSESQRYPYAWHRELARGLAAFDTRHNLIMNFNWEGPASGKTGVAGALLDGWQAGGIVTLVSGFPFSAKGSNRREQETRIIEAGNLRPDLIPDGDNNPVLGGVDQYFDVTQFVPSQPGFFGTVGRNTIIGPGLSTVDLSIMKVFGIGGPKTLQARMEVFNLFNRANFGHPSGTIFDSRGRPDPLGARITTTSTTARQIQLGMRFAF
jgi:outer membrane receptor protein involved in Fe transport